MHRWAWLLWLTGSSAALADPARFEFTEPHMGTTFRLVVYATDRATAEQAQRAAFARVAHLNRVMSDYAADSELMRLCAQFATTTGPAVPVSSELFYVLDRAQALAQRANGAFDVTVGPLSRLWRTTRKQQQLPAAPILAEARGRVGFAHLELNGPQRTVRLAKPGMQLDLGGIAKGYAADEMLRVVETFGITQALAAGSGDIAVSGAPPGSAGWKVEVGRLNATSPRHGVLLAHAAVSTSGDAEQFVEMAGMRYSHVLDPRTGLGLTGRRSVTVIARRGIDADSLTKVASVLTPAQAQAIADDYGAVLFAVRQTDAGEERTQSLAWPGFAVVARVE
jgi:thiamine biosynthesis lipoprotein